MGEMHKNSRLLFLRLKQLNLLHNRFYYIDCACLFDHTKYLPKYDFRHINIYWNSTSSRFCNSFEEYKQLILDCAFLKRSLAYWTIIHV